MAVESSSLLLTPPQTEQQRRLAEQRRLTEAPGFWESTAHAWRAMGSAPAIADLIGGWTIDSDPEFKLTKPLLRELTEGLPEEYWDEFLHAQSLPHAYYLRQTMRERLEARLRLQDAGWTGTAASLMVMAFDPYIWAASAGIGARFVQASNLSRAQSFLREGLAAAGINTVQDSLVASVDPIMGPDEVAWGALSGFVLGGALGAGSRRKAQEPATATVTPLRGGAMRAEYDPRDELFHRARRALSSKSTDHVDVSGTDYFPDRPKLPKPPEPPPTGPRPPDQDLDFSGLPDDVRTLRTFGSVTSKTARIDIGGQLGESPVRGIRLLSHMMVQDVLPKEGRFVRRVKAEGIEGEFIEETFTDIVPSGLSASEALARRMKLAEREWDKAFGPGFRKLVKDMEVPIGKRDEFLDRVYREMAHAIRTGGRPREELAPAVALIQKKFGDLLDVAKRAGLPGFDDIEKDTRWLPRLGRTPALVKAIDRFTHRRVVETIGEAIARVNPELGKMESEALARSWVAYHLKRPYITDPDRWRLVGPRSFDKLIEFLETELKGQIKPEDLRLLKLRLEPKGPGMARAKRRILMEEEFSKDILDDAGNFVGRLTVSDLFENDLERLYFVTHRQILAQVYLKQVQDEFLSRSGQAVSVVAKAEGRPSPSQVMGPARAEEAATWDDVIRVLEDEAGRERVRSKRFQSDIRKLNAVRDYILGIPLEPDSISRQVLDGIQTYEYIRTSGSFGFAQFSELGAVLSDPRFILQSLPEVRAVVRRAVSGKMPNELLDELSEVLPIGMEGHRRFTSHYFEDAVLSGDLGEGRLARYLHLGRNLASEISGVRRINAATRQLAAVTTIQKFGNWALKSPQKLNKTRLGSLGLSPEDATAIIEQIKTHATWERGILGRRVAKLNLDRWDGKTLARFINAIEKFARRATNDNDIGNMSLWMTKTWAKVLTQFRRFTITAWNRHLLYNIATRDRETAIELAWMSGMAALAYTALTYARSIGRKDRQRYLEERLAPAQIANAVFQRAAFSSLLPSFGNVASGTVGLGSIMDLKHTYRNSASDILLRFPAAGLIDQAQDAISGLVSPITAGDDFSRQDAIRLMNLLPYSSALGAYNAIQAVGGLLPEERR